MAVVEAGQISVDEEQIRAFCEKWQIAELALFGSVLRDDFRPDSDIDVLVTFKPGDHWRFRDLLTMQEGLAAMFDRDVDFVERKAVEETRNPFRRKHILENARAVYRAGVA